MLVALSGNHEQQIGNYIVAVFDATRDGEDGENGEDVVDVADGEDGEGGGDGGDGQEVPGMLQMDETAEDGHPPSAACDCMPSAAVLA